MMTGKMNQEWRQYTTDVRWQDDDKMIDNETAKWQHNERLQTRYNEFWRWYSMMNVIDDEMRTAMKQ